MLKWSLQGEVAQDHKAVERSKTDKGKRTTVSKAERVDLAQAEKKLAVLVHSRHKDHRARRHSQWRVPSTLRPTGSDMSVTELSKTQQMRCKNVDHATHA